MKKQKEIIIVHNAKERVFKGPRKPGRSGDKVARAQRSLAASRNGRNNTSVAAAYATGNSGKAPIVQMSKDSCRVVHRELLGGVSGGATAAFTIANTFALNPGIPQTFSWLSNMAQNWETYKFNMLRCCYYTRTGSNTSGSVIIVPDYDASDASPISEQTASSYEDIQEDAPWKDMVCRLRSGAMHPTGSRKFVRSGALAANQDIKLYDVGNLFIATVDSAGAASWGKLWIEYDVTFHTPQLFSTGSNFATINTFNGGVALSQTALFGTAATVYGNFGATAAANTITIPSGLIIGAEYLVSVSFVGTVITAVALSTNVGFTLKFTEFSAFNATALNGNVTATLTATATSGSLVFTCTATSITSSQSLFSLIPTSAF